MRTSKIIKQLAKQDGVSVKFVEAEMRRAIDSADWHKISPNGMKPNSIKKVLLLLAQSVKNTNV